MLLLFTLLLFTVYGAYDISQLNEFSADVDIYDMGMMGRGKNACSWHRSIERKQEVFYYLAMQPWRHLVWTDCTGSECYKFFINEDASSVPAATNPAKLDYKNIDHDYCRKEYAHPMATYEIDWDQIVPFSVLESADVNGRTCYKHPAKQPLAYIYLQKQFTREVDVDVMQPCRYDYIGGKSITFRSYNKFSTEFVGDKQPNGYLLNKTRCNIDPSPNNVDTDLAIILGISDIEVGPKINGALSKLGNLETVKQVKIYYLSGESLKKEIVQLKDLASLKLKHVSTGPVDALLNSAKNELITRINAKAIYRGTIIALMDRALVTTFDAETAFDRNNITVHTVIFNPKGDKQMRSRARALLSIGEHYHEFAASTVVDTVVNELYISIRANLTERCNRTSCNGFCDGRDRCTCPMCCENTCFFTYCNTTTASCMPWPEAKPKEKITCKDDCVGKQECKDLQGCVYTKYNEGCAPRAKCMRPYCDDNNVCKQESSCAADKSPSYNNRCWNYTCNEQNGNCERNPNQFGNECPKLKDLCHEHVCEPITLKCTAQKKTCVKTAPYVEMSCYKAECNTRTGICENVLNCKDLVTFTGCGMTADQSNCVCDAASGFTCSCTKVADPNTPPEGFCTSEQICDASVEGQPPTCKKSACGQDLYKEGCQIKTCNENTGIIEWKEYDCSKNVTILANGTTEEKKKTAEQYCLEKFNVFCLDGDCFADWVEGASPKAACGECIFYKDPVIQNVKGGGKKKTYYVTYEENCNYMELTCPGGNTLKGYEKFFNVNPETNQTITGKCLTKAVDLGNGEYTTTYYCGFAELNEDYVNAEPLTICNECFKEMPCYKSKEHYEITFDKQSGECSFIPKADQPKCSVCNANNDGFVPNCENKNITKEFKYVIDGQEIKLNYDIPKVCYPEDQCIVDHKFKCDDISNPQIKAIYDALAPCGGNTIKAQYKYSLKFSQSSFDNELPQTQAFLDEMEEKAECTYTFETQPCHYCVIKQGAMQNVNKCDAVVNQYKHLGDAVKVTCNERTNECDVKIDEPLCPPVNCWYQYNDMELYKQTGNGCKNASIGTCKTHWDKENEKLAAYIPVKNHPALGDKYPEIGCYHHVQCQPEPAGKAQINCTYEENSNACIQAYDDYINKNKDFGCRYPNVTCDFNTLHCTFIEMIAPENDTRFFQERDEVVFGDKCYNYVCHEFFNKTSQQIEHHWVLTEASLTEINKKPETICDTVHCDPETGKSVSETKKCTPIEDFGLSERMAQCFQCSCSMQTGENVLTMRPNTETETYELDACGNCVVKDRATGNQVNEVVECVLAQPVNLTGAIAGATVAASVVFGLIGSMVVVSIGAFQTYQLVSSAMKNVISTTLENPEFVAADNEATNVLNNGD